MRGKKKKTKMKRDGKRKIRIKGMVRIREEGKRKRCHQRSLFATYIHMGRLDLINKYTSFQVKECKRTDTVLDLRRHPEVKSLKLVLLVLPYVCSDS